MDNTILRPKEVNREKLSVNGTRKHEKFFNHDRRYGTADDQTKLDATLLDSPNIQPGTSMRHPYNIESSTIFSEIVQGEPSHERETGLRKSRQKTPRLSRMVHLQN
jgi:hypothetical protein